MSVAQLPSVLDGTLEAVAVVAKRRTGRRPSPPTVWRWCRKGVRGGTIRLQAAYVSGIWQTTPAAFDEFLAEQTAAALGQQEEENDDSASDAELIAAGLL